MAATTSNPFAVLAEETTTITAKKKTKKSKERKTIKYDEKELVELDRAVMTIMRIVTKNKIIPTTEIAAEAKVGIRGFSEALIDLRDRPNTATISPEFLATLSFLIIATAMRREPLAPIR